MSKPQDFNKKELEKRRMQKRKEKEERKEQRKAESKEGKSFEDMLAYVDENGNITSTPPDPTRKKTISEVEVNLESRNKGGAAAPDERRTGRVTFFNEKKGFGFIRDDASRDSVFVHINALEVNVAENTAVTFEVERTVKGLSAVRVRLKA